MSAAPYTLYVSDVSYYSGKLEACLRYKRIAHARVEINARVLRETILPATGTMKVPVMQCADGRWLKDSTPMIQWLEAQHPAHPVLPADPATRFLALLLEDYADEWMWRPAMYFRWRFADSHRLLRHRLGRELSAGTWHSASALGWYMRWRQYLIFVRGDGVRPHNEAAVVALYTRTLAQLEAVLASQPYLQGARPGIVDFAFFASMFRHFALDPHSARIMVDTAPAVYAWVARVWAARGEDAPADDAGLGNPAWNAVLTELARDYLPYLDANAAAWQRGEKRFDLQLADARYPRMPVVRYRVACRQQLLRGFHALDDSSRQRLLARLAGHPALTHWLQNAMIIDAGLDAEFQLPLQQRYPAARGWHGLKMYFGTPWDIPRKASGDAPFSN